MLSCSAGDDTVNRSFHAGDGPHTLFALTSDAVIDKVHEAFGEMHPELIRSNLSAEEEERLRELFAED